MEFSIAKCKTMHIGSGNIEYNCSMKECQLNAVTTQKKERPRKWCSRDYHFRDLQTVANDVRKAERLDCLPEMQSEATTDFDNSSGTEYKTCTHRNSSMN